MISRDRISRRALIAAGFSAPSYAPIANAQQIPDAGIAKKQLLRIIVPFPAGGPTDALARILADELKSSGDRPVIVENKPGASGTIGTRAVLHAPADDFTVLLGNIQTHATAPFLIKDAGYDPIADFVPICGLVDMHHVLVVRKDWGITSVAVLIERAKATPGKLNFGSTGVGSGSHLAMELFMSRTGTKMQHVPYQGAAQMAGEIAAGRLDLALAVLPTVTAPIEAGQIAALAVASKSRAIQLPTVPTLSEQGVDGAEAESWLALFSRTPAASANPGLTEHLGTSIYGPIIRDRLARPDVQARVEKLGLSLALRQGFEFRAFQSAEIERWGAIIRSIGLKPE